VRDSKEAKMSAIKEFFKKKKADAKFKLAGSGHKLGDPSTSGPRPSQSGGSRAVERERSHPSQSSQQAGAAALNRLAGKESREDTEFAKARQKAIIKERARQELAKEEQMEKEISKIKSVYGEKEDVEVECPGQLAVAGVFFKCELVGGRPGTRDQIKARIREFLYAQLEEEKCLTAVLIIQTCNSPRERVDLCVETLCKYIGNIISNPTEAKFRKIRKSNRAFNERVASLEGSSEFLEGCGFVTRQLEGPDGALEEFWVFPEELTDIENLEAMIDTLQGAEPVAAELDRDLTVLPPSQKIKRELPSDFFNLTKEEFIAEHENRKDQVERETMMRTKAMREKEEAKSKRKYKYCLIRVRFPDGWTLQGTFSVYEDISRVFEMVTDSLETPLPFLLVDSATGSRLEQGQVVSLLDLGLVPASLLTFCWHPDIEADIARSANPSMSFLRQDLI